MACIAFDKNSIKIKISIIFQQNHNVVGIH